MPTPKTNWCLYMIMKSNHRKENDINWNPIIFINIYIYIYLITMPSNCCFPNEKYYVYSIFVTYHKWRIVIVCYCLISSKKVISIGKYKLELTTTYHLWFIVKMLWTYHFSFLIRIFIQTFNISPIKFHNIRF